MWEPGQSGIRFTQRGNDDDAIQRIVHELNFGRYAAGRNGLHTAQQDCPVGRGKEKIA